MRSGAGHTNGRTTTREDVRAISAGQRRVTRPPQPVHAAAARHIAARVSCVAPVPPQRILSDEGESASRKSTAVPPEFSGREPAIRWISTAKSGVAAILVATSRIDLESAVFTGGSWLAGRPRAAVNRVAGFRPDAVKGTDQLNIRREAMTLAMVLVHEDVEPPISVGLFGDWGGGKSFFMSEMWSADRQAQQLFARRRGALLPGRRAT